MMLLSTSADIATQKVHACLQVNFLTRIIGLKPGPELHKLLARVLGGQDEGADIVDEEKARQIDRAAERAGQSQVRSI